MKIAGAASTAWAVWTTTRSRYRSRTAGSLGRLRKGWLRPPLFNGRQAGRPPSVLPHPFPRPGPALTCRQHRWSASHRSTTWPKPESRRDRTSRPNAWKSPVRMFLSWIRFSAARHPRPTTGWPDLGGWSSCRRTNASCWPKSSHLRWWTGTPAPHLNRSRTPARRRTVRRCCYSWSPGWAPASHPFLHWNAWYRWGRPAFASCLVLMRAKKRSAFSISAPSPNARPSAYTPRSAFVSTL